MIVTGAASGIGIETARALAVVGAEVTLAVRDTEAGARVAAEIAAGTGNRQLHVARLDLADRSSIAAFVAKWEGPLHVLVNNAGVMALPEQHTVEGWEMQFAINHLGHFALALGLHHALAAAGSARIVAVSSSAHLRSPVIFDDIHFAFRPYEPILAYAQSKTANVLFAVGATARWARDGITANALMPGAIATNLQRHTGGRPRLSCGRHRRREPPRPSCGHLSAARRARRPLFRGLQRGRRGQGQQGRHGRRRAVRPRCGERRAVVGGVGADARLSRRGSGWKIKLRLEGNQWQR
jgi:NAD(P)-dependent dehydrogenase (short-subunit alcohol dehydrogenase family)